MRSMNAKVVLAFALLTVGDCNLMRMTAVSTPSRTLPTGCGMGSSDVRCSSGHLCFLAFADHGPSCEDLEANIASGSAESGCSACLEGCGCPSTNQGGGSGTGDPHLQNIHGQRFDLMKPGKHLLVHIPRRASVGNTLLRVEAEARGSGDLCAEMYFQEVNVTGSWADAKRVGGFHYTLQTHAHDAPAWVTLGMVDLKVAHGVTSTGTPYLNFYIKHLGRAGFPIGGLLGEDDHEDVVAPQAACVKRTALQSRGAGAGSPYASSAAVASIA